MYAVQGSEETVLINAGTGRAADYLGEVAQNGPVTVLLTHHFRDHTDGAIRLQQAGAEILGPYWDQEYLVDPQQHFGERQIWNSYDNRWDRVGGGANAGGNQWGEYVCGDFGGAAAGFCWGGYLWAWAHGKVGAVAIQL